MYYDSAGNVVYSSSPGGESSSNRSYTDVKNWTFDAAGRMTYWDEHGPWGNQTRSEWTDYDGDGRAVRHDDAENSLTWYYIYSSVTGQRITDIAIDGSFVANHIYMGGTKVAENWGSEISFIANDPVSAGTATMVADGTTEPNNPNFTNETAGLGMSVPLVPLQTYPPLDNYIEGGFVGHAESGCRIDGMEFGPDMCDRSAAFTVPCPNNNCGPRRYRDPGDGKLKWTFPYEHHADGGGYRVPTTEKTCVITPDGKVVCDRHAGTKFVPFGDGEVPDGNPFAGPSARSRSQWDFQKAYEDTFSCNRSVRDIFDRMRTNFPDFANFTGSVGPGGVGAGANTVHFGKKLIAKGAVIPITVTGSPYGTNITAVFDLSVTVAWVTLQTQTHMGFGFTTNPGHVLYPAEISFIASNVGNGRVNFSIGINGNYPDVLESRVKFWLGGKNSEDQTWNNFIRNVSQYCGN